MAHLKRKTTTRPLPAGAEIIERKGRSIAKWRGRDGRTRTAPVSRDGTRISDSSVTWYAVWTDADGRTRTENTGCKDRTAAQAWLAAREREVELERAGVVTATEARAGKAADAPVLDHLTDFLAHLRAKGTTEQHMRGRERCIQAALQACRAVALRDLTREGLERFLESLVDRGRSARTVNHYRISMQSFARWLVREGRLASSPFEGLAARDEQADRRLVRRAFTDEELVALLDAARRRPAHDKCTRHRGKGAANVSKATLDRAETRGRERALIYEVLAGTGLRVNELRSVRVRDLVLDANPPRVHLRAAHAKNRRDAVLPLHPEIAAHLREWIEERRKRALEESMRAGAPTPLSDDAPVFRIPTSFVHVLDRDLAFAGIPKRDAAGRSLDVHALRTTFAVRLARRNVPLQTAQKLMRHSDPRLTASVYSLLSVEDLAEAVGRLPSLTDLSARDGAADAQ